MNIINICSDGVQYATIPREKTCFGPKSGPPTWEISIRNPSISSHFDFGRLTYNFFNSLISNIQFSTHSPPLASRPSVRLMYGGAKWLAQQEVPSLPPQLINIMIYRHERTEHKLHHSQWKSCCGNFLSQIFWKYGELAENQTRLNEYKLMICW